MSAGDWKAMFKGVQENDLDLVKYYLKIGVDPNYQHPEFMALPLSESIRYNHMDMAELLLNHGAKPQTKEIESEGTCLDVAIKLNNKHAINLLNSFIVQS